ncbi:MAG: restriction endonuclease subunit S [Candidatus Gastranaerophilales bacterium]|nr:restriction endonuclease subunit S [Candidatus Gastranaerophilales bacterium]
MGKLKQVKLENLCILVTDGTHDSPRLLTKGYPLIKGKDINQGYIKFENCDYISLQDHLKVISRSKPEYGDILFANIGSIGDLAYVNTMKEFSIKNVALIKPDNKKINNLYLYYYMLSSSFQDKIKSIKQGAAQPFISLNLLRNFEIKIIENVNVQQKIAKILSNYDDLIENNNKRIKILEEMAQKIYKEWFVDFKFPGAKNATFKDSELGKIPSDWNVIAVEVLLKRLKSKNKYTQDNVLPNGDTIVIDQSTAEFLGFHNNTPDFYATPKKPLIIFGDHTSKMQMLVENFSIGPNVIPITSEIVPIAFLYYLIDSLIETKEYKRHWNDLIAKKVILPTNSLAECYSKIIIPLMATINHLKHKNMNLKRTRDILLPHLISGEIDVENLEIK